ncbi:hypothetical protein MA16_Dca017213 [Dendrobium catenatum]|uniref:Uncharacterized protein n=1 Tax=Dendrobium catenatum TaxID=906689 RepID=A0A2I0W2P3_9ASPA|nr:hypothetical protein MA16_Dca017213 [Dendrobium catenatum]
MVKDQFRSFLRWSLRVIEFDVLEQWIKNQQDQEPRGGKLVTDSELDGWLMRNCKSKRAWVYRKDWGAGVCSMLERRHAMQEQMSGLEACSAQHGHADHGRNIYRCRRAWVITRWSASWSHRSELIVEVVHEQDLARFGGFYCGDNAMSQSDCNKCTCDSLS